MYIVRSSICHPSKYQTSKFFFQDFQNWHPGSLDFQKLKVSGSPVKRELVSAPGTSRWFSHVLWLKAHNHRLLRAYLLGSKRKLPPPVCQARLGLLSVVCRLRGVLFPGTVYTCNQGPLSSTWAHCTSYAPSAYSLCRRYCCPLQCDSTWELAWSLQEIQPRTTDHDLCLSCIYSQPFLLHCFFPCQEPSDTFLQWFSYDNKVVSIEVLPWDPTAELTWQCFQHNDEKQQTENRALVNTNLHFKLFTVPLTNTDMAPGIGIHSLYQTHYPLIHTKFPQCPPHDLPGPSVKCLLKVNESHVKSLVDWIP